jgi:hypothetical protein
MAALKQRHYPRISRLVRRDRTDSGVHELEHPTPRRLAGRIFADMTAPPVTPASPKLIGTAGGDISRMLLTIPNYAVAEEIMAAAYRSLLSQLTASVRLVVLMQEDAEATIRSWLTEFGLDQRADVDVFENELNISIWAEDGYVVAYDEASTATYFVEPYTFPRYADGLVSDFVTNFTDLKNTQAPLYFQGGNVLVGDDFFMIGADYPAHTLQYIAAGVLTPPAGVSATQFVHDQYQKYLDRKRRLVYVGSGVPVPVEQTRATTINGETWRETICAGNAQNTVQPLFHIDMFVTLIGRMPGGKFGILVGDPSKAYAILGGRAPAHAMQPVFDDIAARLAAAGFDVIRNPLPLVYMDDPAAKQRSWYFATANNALVQNGSTKEVWLPTYGYGDWTSLQKTDAANRAIWEGLGFTTHMLTDFHPFAENLGAVHCIKKYLARS